MDGYRPGASLTKQTGKIPDTVVDHGFLSIFSPRCQHIKTANAIQAVPRSKFGEGDSVVKIDHLAAEQRRIMWAMKVSEKQVLAVPCPTCGAKRGEKCALTTGLPRTDPHRDRRLAAAEK
jgi:hypothetical protein